MARPASKRYWGDWRTSIYPYLPKSELGVMKASHTNRGGLCTTAFCQRSELSRDMICVVIQTVLNVMFSFFART